MSCSTFMLQCPVVPSSCNVSLSLSLVSPPNSVYPFLPRIYHKPLPSNFNMHWNFIPIPTLLSEGCINNPLCLWCCLSASAQQPSAQVAAVFLHAIYLQWPASCCRPTYCLVLLVFYYEIQFPGAEYVRFPLPSRQPGSTSVVYCCSVRTDSRQTDRQTYLGK